MTDDVLVREIATRANVSVPSARAVLEALSAQELRTLAFESGPHEAPAAFAGFPAPTGPAYDEDSPDVVDLIERATAHPLGVEFLRDGYLDCVAATFRTHAFVVEAARRRLR